MREVIVIEHNSLDGTMQLAFKVTESKVTPNGVIVVNYERAGGITTGRGDHDEQRTSGT